MLDHYTTGLQSPFKTANHSNNFNVGYFTFNVDISAMHTC
jgi:hypothetical protein